MSDCIVKKQEGGVEMKIVVKNDVKKAMKELKTRALACEPHSMCPKCLRGRG